MNKFVLPLAFVVSLVAGSAAFASTDHTSTGTIKKLDAKACTVEVGKTTYHFAKGCDFSALKVGENVSVTGHVFKKMEVGTKIVAAATPAPAKPAPVKTMTKTTTTAPKKTS